MSHFINLIREQASRARPVVVRLANGDAISVVSGEPYGGLLKARMEAGLSDIYISPDKIVAVRVPDVDVQDD